MPGVWRTLVIGYGSPIRGDDAIGPLAADALAAAPLPPGWRVLSRHVLTAELAEDLAAVDRVIFLDASVRAGVELDGGVYPFLNLRAISGGATGTSSNPTPPGDGYNRNWLTFMSLSLGVDVR